jgi:Tol biopolymer transport system component
MSQARTIRCSVAAVLFLVICGLSAPAAAQYFGRNKVQYKTFDFQVLKTEHFDIYFYPSEKDGVDIAARMAERWYVRLERLLQHRLRGRQPLILYGSHVDFEQTNVIGGELGEGTGGVTETLRRRIVLPLAGPLADTDHVVGHELVHAFQFDMTTSAEMEAGETGAHRLPLWFVEGMAEYLSIGPVDSNTAMWLRDATRREKLPTIRDLDKPEYFPYRWGQAFWAYVGGRWGDEVIARMLIVAAAQGVEPALEQVLGIDAKQLSADWHAAILKTYTPVLTAPTRTTELGRLVVEGEEMQANINVAPSVSPDGKWLAYVSTRGFFSVDVYVAEAATGRIVKRLTSTATDAHFSSIQFIHSAGAWDRASQQIAVATVASGRAALAVFDAERGSLSREFVVPDVDEILNPTWAPDGSAIGFTGLRQGLTDLYVYDLNSGALRQLTNDAYADLQPAWSPDGKRIAFATDRFTSDLATLAIGQYRLATIDLASSAIEQVKATTDGRQTNPQWTPDGMALYFLSDRDGAPNVYRTPVGAERTETLQITTVVTGVSGITALSPAVSVAQVSGDVLYSLYQGGKYDIATLGTNPAGIPPRSFPVNAAALPPVERRPSEVAELLNSPALGLPPEDTEYQVEPYKPKLALTGVAQPVVGVGVSRFGTSFGGGLAMQFSDELGDHILTTAVQLNSIPGGGTSVKDIGAQVGYFNLARRWNWGLIGGQVPYTYGGYQASLPQRLPNGDVVQTERLVVNRQTELSASAVVSYPFSRASRIEFQGGPSRISFDQVVTSTTYSLYTGAVYDQSSQTVEYAPPLNLGTSSVAYVFDTSVFGATSPVQGQRYRFEASPTFGSLNFTGLLADYRRYFMPVPFYTVAVRAMQFGRYGSGSEDPRIYPLFIGYPWLVRGYDPGSVQSYECGLAVTVSCPLLDNMYGSRMLIGGAELRFPVLRPFGVSGNMYGPVPVEVALFVDGGTAWFAGEKPTIFGGTKDGVTSAGVAFRVNLFGFAVGEFDFARPFQRPGRSWIFGFNLMSGW